MLSAEYLRKVAWRLPAASGSRPSSIAVRGMQARHLWNRSRQSALGELYVVAWRADTSSGIPDYNS